MRKKKILKYSEIELGIEIDSEAGFKDSNVIALPSCDRCDVKESLLRTWDQLNELDTSKRFPRSKTVNRLALYLKGVEPTNL